MKHVALFAFVLLVVTGCTTAPEKRPERTVPYGEPPPLVVIVEPAEPKEPAAPEPPPPEDTEPSPTTEPPPSPPVVVTPGELLPALGRGEVPDAEPPEPPGLDRAKTMTVHVLDIGQGAATLFELPCGTILVDTGGEMNGDFDSTTALVHQLDAFFARRKDLKRTIDLLVITHPHIDHVRGVPTVLEKYKVKNVIEGGFPFAKNVTMEMNRLRDFVAGGTNAKHRAILRDDIPPSGFTDAVIDPIKCKVDPVIRVLSGRVMVDPGWKDDKHGKDSFTNANNHSVVLRVDFGESSMLITGDLEEPAIEDLVAKYESKPGGMLDVDVYQAGHHGSANGTTRALMSAMTPEVAVIQMGAAWRRRSWSAWQYGHPREVIVDMLRAGVSQKRRPRAASLGVKSRVFAEVPVSEAVYGTGWDGPIAIDMHADGTVTVRPPLK